MSGKKPTSPRAGCADAWELFHRTHPNALADFAFVSGFALGIAYCGDHGMPGRKDHANLLKAAELLNELARRGGRPIPGQLQKTRRFGLGSFVE
jgi:hypothetical protein